jgi:hypothetical protein
MRAFVARAAATHHGDHRFLFGNGFAQILCDFLHRVGSAGRAIERRNIVVFDQRVGQAPTTRIAASAAIGSRQHTFDGIDSRVFVNFEFLRHKIKNYGGYYSDDA